MTHASGRLEVAEAAAYGLGWQDEVVELGAADGGKGHLRHVPIVHVAYPHHVRTHQLLHLSTVPVAIIIERGTARLNNNKFKIMKANFNILNSYLSRISILYGVILPFLGLIEGGEVLLQTLQHLCRLLADQLHVEAAWG